MLNQKQWEVRFTDGAKTWWTMAWDAGVPLPRAHDLVTLPSVTKPDEKPLVILASVDNVQYDYSNKTVHVYLRDCKPRLIGPQYVARNQPLQVQQQ